MRERQETFVNAVNFLLADFVALLCVGCENVHDSIAHVLIQRIVRTVYRNLVLAKQLSDLKIGQATDETKIFRLLAGCHNISVIIGKHDNWSII